MKDPILILGPSGIGKTTATKNAMKHLKHVRFVVLDNIAHRAARESGLIDKKDNLNALISALGKDRNRFFDYGMQALHTFMGAHTASPVVVDVGTGFLDSNRSLGWITNKPSLAITAESAIAYDRFKKARKLDISYEQYCSTQFSEFRMDCYNSAGLVIKSDQLSEEMLSQRFLFCLLSLLDEADRKQALVNYI